MQKKCRLPRPLRRPRLEKDKPIDYLPSCKAMKLAWPHGTRVAKAKSYEPPK